MGKLKIYIPFLCFMNTACATNTSKICQKSNPEVIEQLNKVYYGKNKIRIFYTTQGDNAIKDKTDHNQNNIPDYIENIAIQTETVMQAWDALGYQNPLQSPRYKSAKYIDIHIQKLSGLGIAYSKAHLHTNNPLKENKCALIISLSNNITNFTTQSSVAAHELFHLYIYGYTMFKPKWLNEGLAAWSEGIIRKGKTGAYGDKDLPKTKKELEQDFLQRSYQASKVWSSITILTDQSNGKLLLPNNILEKKYTDGQPVFQDHYLKGTIFIQKFLQNLGKEDKHLSKTNHWQPYSWKDSTQKSQIYNKNIISVLLKSLENNSVPENNQNILFESLLKQQTE
ncbi:peptidase MA family protein [Acinetobacter halotolerans]|uniref:Peptidase MA family protein n=1 Tax=Acinetobacter halotolerans TaxID=1752076 RepID=A0A4Q6XDR9_9GAMM|nr:peptidase MA family protein [Acinetobacter halotolerans]RZF55626.1 peptidase MA family protein [Acinetobacter halotolerans]